MIRTKQELKFYMKADYMMNRGVFTPSWKQRIRDIFIGDQIIRFLCLMRKTSYYRYIAENRSRFFGGGIFLFYKILYGRVSRKLGFSIGSEVFGYGLVIPHYGTIVVGSSNRIGNYAVLHTSTCISDNRKVIGDGLYLSTGAKMTSSITLGNNISVGANSLVNKSLLKDNVMIAGAPAKEIKVAEAWYIRDGRASRVEQIEALKKKMNLTI